jgi:hypothetical protein
MKRPKFSLRELFLLVTLVAMALGWLLTWDRWRVDYNGNLNEVMRARHHEDQLRVQIQGEGYAAEWDEKANTYKLTKFNDMKREDRASRAYQGLPDFPATK